MGKGNHEEREENLTYGFELCPFNTRHKLCSFLLWKDIRPTGTLDETSILSLATGCQKTFFPE
jgi:hypothetical protein